MPRIPLRVECQRRLRRFRDRLVTYTKTNGAHDCHGENIKPCVLEPLAKAGSCRHRVRLSDTALAAVAPASEHATTRGGSSGALSRLLGGSLVLVEQTHYETVDESKSYYCRYSVEVGLAYVPGVEAATLLRSDAVVGIFSSIEKNAQVNRKVVEGLWRVLIYILSEPCRLPAKGREDRRDDALARPQSPDNESRLVWARSVVAVVEF